MSRLVFTAGTTPLVCDVAAMRGGDLFLDLQARDFTVNAMAMRWQGRGSHELVDLASGQADIAARLLRRVTPTGLAEDPIRLLRAVRLAVQLGFTIEDQTHLQIPAHQRHGAPEQSLSASATNCGKCWPRPRRMWRWR